MRLFLHTEGWDELYAKCCYSGRGVYRVYPPQLSNWHVTFSAIGKALSVQTTKHVKLTLTPLRGPFADVNVTYNPRLFLGSVADIKCTSAQCTDRRLLSKESEATAKFFQLVKKKTRLEFSY